MKAVELNQSEKPSKSGSVTNGNIILRLLGLMLFDAGAMWMMIAMWSDGYWQFALVVLVITVLINYIWLKPNAYPLRWMSPGLAFMILISVYPILYTVYISFTNFGTGHLLPKVQTIEVLEQRTFVPEASGAEFNFVLYKNAFDQYALWLIPNEGSDMEPVVVIPGNTLAETPISEMDEDDIPVQIIVPGEEEAVYERVPRGEMLKAISALSGTIFGDEEVAVQIKGMDRASVLEQQYVYDEEADTMYDVKNDVLYFADGGVGSFVSTDGDVLIPGYIVNIGIRNYQRFIGNPAFRGPLVLIFVWTVVFALLSTFLSFSLGLLIALAFGRDMPGQKLIKSLLIIPFAIPQVLTILVWRGLWNPLNGIVGITLNNILLDLTGSPVNVFADPFWVKFALITVNVWLAYPYYVLINSGALQALPQDMYEAADIDGASAWSQFRFLTLPLLLVGVGPLLIGSFLVNFNSFNVIFLFNSGGPPIVGTPTPAGHSDILISYVYRLAFGSGGGQNFGYAAAITVIIFFILVAITFYQFRYMKIWEEVGESV